MEVARHVQSTQNRKLAIFLQYVEKKVLQLLLCSIVIQNIEILYMGPVMFIITCFSEWKIFHKDKINHVHVYNACLWSNGLVVKALDSQSRGPVFKTTEWLQGRLSLSSFQGRQNEYHEFLET